jgi:hypothetical protein
MHPYIPTSAQRRGVGAALTIVGMSLWLAAVALHVTPVAERDVNFPHMEARLLAIVTGGASVTGGIALLASA